MTKPQTGVGEIIDVHEFLYVDRDFTPLHSRLQDILIEHDFNEHLEISITRNVVHLNHPGWRIEVRDFSNNPATT